MNSLESLRIFGPHSWAFQQLMYLQYVHLDSGPVHTMSEAELDTSGDLDFGLDGGEVRLKIYFAQPVDEESNRCSRTLLVWDVKIFIHVNCWATSIISCFQDRFEVTTASFQPAKSTGCALASVPSNFRKILSKAWKLQVALEKICTDPPLIGVPICTPRTMQTG